MSAAIEIHFVTGKGGVGKSTAALAMALAFARSGKKTLLVELSSESFFQDALDRAVTPDPQRYRDNLDIAAWSGTSCLREYALHLLKSETLYKLFLQNSVSKTLIQVAPGLSELAMIGKVTSGPPRNIGPKLNYDILIVDAFASGHFMALLKAPFGFAETVRFGPMGEQSRSIIEVIKNPKICFYHLVTLPEELPTAETLELAKQIQGLLGIQPRILINRWLDFEANSARPAAFEKYLQALDSRQKRSEKQFSEKPVHLPWVFSSQFPTVAENLSEALHV